MKLRMRALFYTNITMCWVTFTSFRFKTYIS